MKSRSETGFSAILFSAISTSPQCGKWPLSRQPTDDAVCLPRHSFRAKGGVSRAMLLLFAVWIFAVVSVFAESYPDRPTASEMQVLVISGTQCARGVNERCYAILEIGSWVGESAVLWADRIKANKMKGNVICIDPWEAFEDKNNEAYIMVQALKRGLVFPLFWHNIKVTGNEQIVVPIRGKSEEVMPFLRPSAFDIIFIDGSHFYSAVIRDLQNAVCLLKDGGVICGDDLESQLPDIDAKLAKENKEKDYIYDPKADKSYHPGVTLAISEFFGGIVSVYNGFWAMRKINSKWEHVRLDRNDPR